MAKARKHISLRPSKGEQGGNFGFPPGSKVTITEAVCTTWGEAADEKALKGGRKADDPCLKIVGEIAGMDDPREAVLGAGKSEFLEPSDDGEFFDPVDDSKEGLNVNCNAFIFLDSLCDKEVQGKNVFPEEKLDDPGVSSLVGLVFIAGSKKIERDFADNDDDGGRKKGGRGDRALIATEIISLPGKGKAKKKAVEEDDEEEEVKPKKKKAVVEEEEDDEPAPKKKAKKPADDDEEEEEPAPKKKKKAAADDDDLTEAAEEAFAGVLANPKFRKGVPKAKAYTATFAAVKDEDNGERICEEYISNEKWMQSSKRPWEYDSDEELYTMPKD